MSERIQERISVVTVYSEKRGSVLPWKIRWRGRIYTITKIGYHHTNRAGRVLYHYFSVTNGKVFFRLSHNTESLTWLLEEVSDEPGA